MELKGKGAGSQGYPRGVWVSAPIQQNPLPARKRGNCRETDVHYRFLLTAQNLRVKSFVGTSQNALLTQIWTALIAMLLLRWMHHLSKAKWSFSNLASMLRLNLFTYRNLRRWLDNPVGTPPLVPLTQQLSLALS